MELEPKTSDLAKTVIERVERRDLTADRSTINPQTVRRNLRPKSKKKIIHGYLLYGIRKLRPCRLLIPRFNFA